MLAERSWGVQLWDQTSNLIKYQESGIALHEKLQKFILEIGKLQVDSFLIQKRICEKALINIKKVVGLETTFGQGYNAFIHAIAKLIDTENILPVSFNLQANGEMKLSLDEERKSMKQWRHDRDRFQSETKNQARIIDEEIKRYHDKYREVIRSKEDYDRVDEVKSYSKLDVEKALIMYTVKHNEFKRARSDFSAALEQFNFHRRYHYNTTVKNWGEAGQTLESYRITKTRELISILVERLRVMIERLTTVATDLESAAAMMDAEKDSDTLIERLKTGNEPPRDVPFTQLEVPDPPPCSTQLNGRSSGENGYAEKSSSRRMRSISIAENGDNAMHYASIQVSPAVGRVSSPFAGADPIIEPTECYKLSTTPTTTCPTLGRSGRRFSASLAPKEGNTGNGHNFLWKVFARRSKRMHFGDDSAVPFEATRPWRCKRRSKSVGSYIPTETGPLLSETSEKNSLWRYKTHRSRDGERRSESVNRSRLSKSQSPRDSPKKIEMVNGDKKTTEAPISINGSDGDAEVNLSVPTLASCSAPLVKSSQSTQEMIRGTEISRSLSSPTSGSNGTYGSNTKLLHLSTFSQPESKSPEYHSIGTPKDASDNGAQYQRGSIVGTTPGSNISQQKAQRCTSPRRNAHHQPKRQNASHYHHHHQPNKRNTDNKMINGSTVSDLIAVGTCKALYDFESSEYGETFISFKSGDELRLISSSTKWHGNPDTDGWIYAETIPPSNDPKVLARRGFIPAAFVEINLYPEPHPLTLPRKRDLDDCSNYRGSHNNLRIDHSFLSLGQATEL